MSHDFRTSSQNKGEEVDKSGRPTKDDRPRAAVAGREMPLPRSRLLRMAVGVALILGGVLGFLPVIGFWMAPLGLAVMAYDIPAIGRLRDRAKAWFERRRSR